MLKDIRLQGGRLQWAALDNGQHGKPLVLALHGWLDNANSFRELARHLDGLHLVALDLPGHGHSDNKPDFYHFIDWIGDLAELVAAQGWDRFHLLGHSMGALIASCFAGAYPEHVQRLILLEGVGPLTARPEDTITQMRSAFDARGKRGGSRPVSLEQAVQARCAVSDLSADHARLLLSRNIDPRTQRWLTDPRLRALSPIRMTDSQAEVLLRGIQAPTLLLLAEQGYPMLKKLLERRRNWFADLTEGQHPGGHHFHLEDPQGVAGSIYDFLKYAGGASR